MLITLEQLKQKFNLNIKGIIHCGAHHAEESDDYERYGISKVVWVEGNSELVPIVESKVSNLPENKVLNYLIYDEDGKELEFKITNNTQSSSVLDFGTHKHTYPGINFIKSQVKKAYTLKHIIEKENLKMEDYNMLNLDLQGVELRALKGMGDYIDSIDYVYTEINDAMVYEGNDLLVDLEDYLLSKGLYRADIHLLSHLGWGDAFYVRRPVQEVYIHPDPNKS
ncbi:FkbM family methyltransferase [bacterium]|nr:FkbM family methyltransferase [bacterium]